MKPQSFEAPDRTRTVVEWFGEETTPLQGLVVFLPALGASVDFYRTAAEAWAEMGYRVATVELRGGKQSSVQDVRAQNFGYHEILNVDLASLLPKLQAEAAGRPLFLAGHSLGGQLALLYASRHPDQVSAVIVLAGGSSHFGTLPPGRRLRRRLELRAVRAILAVLRFFPGDKLGFGGRQPRNMMLDWSHEGLTGSYRVRGDPTDYDQALAQLTLPVLMVSLQGDALISPASVGHVARKLTRAQVTSIELRAEDGKPYHHFHWAKKPGPILAAIDDWVNARFPHDR